MTDTSDTDIATEQDPHQKQLVDYELSGDQIAHIPDDFPQMTSCVFDVWFRITRGLEVEGPFLTRDAAEGVCE